MEFGGCAPWPGRLGLGPVAEAGSAVAGLNGAAGPPSARHHEPRDPRYEVVIVLLRPQTIGQPDRFGLLLSSDRPMGSTDGRPGEAEPSSPGTAWRKSAASIWARINRSPSKVDCRLASETTTAARASVRLDPWPEGRCAVAGQRKPPGEPGQQPGCGALFRGAIPPHTAGFYSPSALGRKGSERWRSRC